MARRDLSTDLTVRMEPQRAQPNVLAELATLGEKLITTSQEAKITEYAAKAQTDLVGLDMEYRKKSELDPFDKELASEYQTKRQEILAGYRNQVSPMFRMQWDESASRIAGNSDKQLESWRYQQAAVNSKNAIATAMETNFLQANKAGLAYGQNPNEDLTHLMDFSVSQKELTDFAGKNLGTASAQALLKDYQKDYFKSFITGAAQSNPKRADELLKRPEISALFDTKETEELQALMARSVKRKTIDELTAENNYGNVAMSVVYGDGDYFDKRTTIDKMELAGQLDSKTATQARRVLTSTKSLTDRSESSTMANIITQMYDLNAIQETDSEGYLVGVRNLRNEILTQQADGTLSAADAKKLGKQLDQLSGQKMAQATQRVGIDFYDAKDKFNLLAPQYRGEAIRELFYRTEGQELSSAEMNQHALKIVDEMKQRARASSVANVAKFREGGYAKQDVTPKVGVAAPQPALTFDRAKFMQTHKLTEASLSETAKKYGISEDEVLRRLYAKTGGK